MEVNQIQYMDNTFEKLSEFITDAVAGDPLPRTIKQTIADAFAIIAQAHRTSTRGARPNQVTERIRILIENFPDWRRSLTDIERRVIEIKFAVGTEPAVQAIELTNSETGEKLDRSK